MESAPESNTEINNEYQPADLTLTCRTIHWSKTLSEIPIFVFFFAYAFSETVYSNLILYRTCTVTFGYNETLCSSLISSTAPNTTRELEEIIQYHASKIIMVKSLVTGIFPAIVSLFLGPWSDSNGRKPLILATMIGYCSYFCISAWFSLWDTLDPWWLVLPAIPYSLLGGLSSLITGCFCYISDITDSSNRSYRMGVMEGVLLTGILIGSIISPYAFKALGYASIFFICALVIFLSLLYTIYLEESLPIHEFNRCSMFDIKLVSGMLKTCFKKRSNYRRTILWCVMLSSSFAIFAQEGDLTINYLFVREKLSWNLQDFAWYGAFSILSSVVGIAGAAFILQKLLKLEDSIISMLAFLSCVARSVITAVANKPWHLYLGSGVSLLRAAFGPTNRAMLSKVVPSEDVGKVLSLTTSLETIIPLISGPVYSLVYQCTLDSFPGAYNIISAAISIGCLLLIGIVDILKRHYSVSEYSPLEEQ